MGPETAKASWRSAAMRVSPQNSATLVLVQDLTQPSLKPYLQLQTLLLLLTSDHRWAQPHLVYVALGTRSRG